jgi:outer membrane protein TolC
MTLGCALLWLSALVHSAEAAELTADEAVAAALSRSPALARARAAVEEDEGARRAACGLRHDPTLGASAALGGQSWSASVAQPLSLTGAGRADCAAARHGQQAAAAQLDRAVLEVAAATRLLWIEAVVAHHKEALAARALDVARRIEDAARQREAVGEVSQLDLRLARLAGEQARAAWMRARVEQGRTRAALATELDADLETLTLPEDPLAGAGTPAGPGAARRSDVVAAEARHSAAAAALARERAGTLAPVSFGAFVEEEGAGLRAGPSLSLTLPVWRGNADGRAAAGGALLAAASARDAAEREAAAQQRVAREVGRALEAALADQGADIPAEARAALESVALGYDRGELDLLTTALLQGQILEGHSAWLDGRGAVAGARVARMLAEEDPQLLGGAAR